MILSVQLRSGERVTNGLTLSCSVPTVKPDCVPLSTAGADIRYVKIAWAR